MTTYEARTIEWLTKRATVTFIAATVSMHTSPICKRTISDDGKAIWNVTPPDFGDGTATYEITMPAHKDCALERAAAIRACRAARMV